MKPLAPSSRAVARGCLAAALIAPAASAQLSFSIDWRSRSIAQLSSNTTGIPITEADILSPAPGAPAIGVLQNVSIRIVGDNLSLQNFGGCQGHPPQTPCGIELDALSSGRDDLLFPVPPAPGAMGPTRRRLWFSVDEWAGGLSPAATPVHAQVVTEGNNANNTWDASADVFVDINLPTGPLPPGAVTPNNAGTIDGNGQQSSTGFVYLGVGLREPNNPLVHNGDNLDALEIGTDLQAPGVATFLSLDSGFFDRLNGANNSNTAANNGFRGADVLRVIAASGLPLQLYAPSNQLGLDLVGGMNTDDLDALALRENGDGVFQPSQTPYDWVGGATDMLLFSVRRGSAVINQPDSIFGIPIQPGDILTTPLPTALGGLSPFPGIFIAAENLGLRTARGVVGQHGDDLDALDITAKPCFDCNENGVEDAVDIATGSSSDANMNGIPDECEDKVVEFCSCPSTAPSPCGNTYASGGCKNSTSLGAVMLTNIAGGGSVSVANDDLTFTTTQTKPFVSAIMFMGTTSKPPAPFEDGIRCIATPTFRFGIRNSGPTATTVYGPGVIADAILRFGPAGTIDPGETWYFQTWYRDTGGPCGNNSNVSNAVKVTFEP